MSEKTVQAIAGAVIFVFVAGAMMIGNAGSLFRVPLSPQAEILYFTIPNS